MSSVPEKTFLVRGSGMSLSVVGESLAVQIRYSKSVWLDGIRDTLILTFSAS